MKGSIIAATALLATSAVAAPGGDWHRGGWKKGGWKSDKWNKGCDKADKGPIPFTSTYHVIATPDQVVNGTTPTGGLPGAKGEYDLGINSDLNMICWYIKLTCFRGDYASAADTATHMHEAARGASGPPRIAFPNPVGNEKEAISAGCLQGPFMTGITDATTGLDTGADFHVSEIEANPAAFFCDVHSSLAVPGAVRGQIA